jgi:hypothetical protein
MWCVCHSVTPSALLVCLQRCCCSCRSSSSRGAAAAAPLLSSDWRSPPEEMTAAAELMCSFAQAVTGRIPLSIACNNPSCTNLAQRSELVLVGGKSCVCARCKAARCGSVYFRLVACRQQALLAPRMAAGASSGGPSPAGVHCWQRWSWSPGTRYRMAAGSSPCQRSLLAAVVVDPWHRVQSASDTPSNYVSCQTAHRVSD